MVKLHIKRADESQFLFETTTSITINDLIQQISMIYNGRLKVHRLCHGKWHDHALFFVYRYLFVLV
jgi:cilia- and flagella-associated protein 298